MKISYMASKQEVSVLELFVIAMLAAYKSLHIEEYKDAVRITSGMIGIDGDITPK